MDEIKMGWLTGLGGAYPDGEYLFAVTQRDPCCVLLLSNTSDSFNRRISSLDPAWQFVAAHYRYGYTVSASRVRWTKPVPPWDGDFGKLALVTIGDEFNTHKAPDGTLVYVRHRTAQVLVPLAEVNLSQEWGDHQVRYPYLDRDDFIEEMRDLTHEADDIEWCDDCEGPVAEVTDVGGRTVCTDCRQEYFCCSNCEAWVHDDCGVTLLNERTVCESCSDRYTSLCQECDGAYMDSDEEYHQHGRCSPGGDCESPAPVFTIRNDGLDPLPNDTRATITLPAGVISGEGLDEIGAAIRNWAMERYYTGRFEAEEDRLEYSKWHTMASEIEEIGDKWQTGTGNYTKRLSRWAHQGHQLKVPPELVSTVGNIASVHSRGVDHQIEVTRALNLSAEEFAHEDSCWWGSYYHGRCALKTNGGFGLRTFGEDGWVEGRAWVLPLRLDPDRRLGDPRAFEPTFDTMEPDAFVVFNGYGNLDGYTPARILSHMAGLTYRKVQFVCTPMYVNSEAGYLVASEEIAAKYTDGFVEMTVPQHADLFETEQSNLRETVNV